MQIDEHTRILDIGCGAGRFSLALAKSGAQVTGTDVSSEMIMAAKELAEKGFQFSSANSINIGRLVPQIVYYVYAYAKLLEAGEIEKSENINVVVPTGNFGNILAAILPNAWDFL